MPRVTFIGHWPSYLLTNPAPPGPVVPLAKAMRWYYQAQRWTLSGTLAMTDDIISYDTSSGGSAPVAYTANATITTGFSFPLFVTKSFDGSSLLPPDERYLYGNPPSRALGYVAPTFSAAPPNADLTGGIAFDSYLQVSGQYLGQPATWRNFISSGDPNAPQPLGVLTRTAGPYPSDPSASLFWSGIKTVAQGVQVGFECHLEFRLNDVDGSLFLDFGTPSALTGGSAVSINIDGTAYAGTALLSLPYENPNSTTPRHHPGGRTASLSNLTLTPTRFWPYANDAGTALYDTTTGAKLSG